MDLIMPEMDGFTLLGELRREPAWATIPAVVITSKDLTTDERAYLNGKVEGILQKGAYSRDAMLGEVRNIISRCVKRNPDGTEVPCDKAVMKLPSLQTAELDSGKIV